MEGGEPGQGAGDQVEAGDVGQQCFEHGGEGHGKGGLGGEDWLPAVERAQDAVGLDAGNRGGTGFPQGKGVSCAGKGLPDETRGGGGNRGRRSSGQPGKGAGHAGGGPVDGRGA